jgi:hypothetical protein
MVLTWGSSGVAGSLFAPLHCAARHAMMDAAGRRAPGMPGPRPYRSGAGCRWVANRTGSRRCRI